MNKFEDIIRELSESLVQSESLEEYYEKISSIYEEEPRHKYSSITAYVYNDTTDEKIEILQYNLYEIRGFIGDDCKAEDAETKIKLDKLSDHIHLAVNQKKLIEDKYNESKLQLRDINSEFLEVKKELEEKAQQISTLKKDAKQLEESIENSEKKTHDFQSKIYTNFITVLGIFTAIVFSMFGGLKLLEFVLLSIDKTPVWKATIFFSMFAIATLSMLFILIRWVSIIVDNVTSRERKLNFIRILSSHFGFVFSIIFFLYLIFLGVLFSGDSVKVNFQSWLAGFSNYLIMGFVFLLPIIIIILFLIIYFKKNNEKI